MGYTTFLGFTLVLPRIAAPYTWRWSLQIAGCLTLLANCIFNYLAAALTNPGTADSDIFGKLIMEAQVRGAVSPEAVRHPELQPIAADQYGEVVPDDRAWVVQRPEEWGYCPRSGALKPPRAHYCHVRKALVLNMDHYCVWIFNTVGFANYKHFILFLFYYTLGTTFAFISCVGPYIELLASISPLEHHAGLDTQAAAAAVAATELRNAEHAATKVSDIKGSER